MRPLAFRSLLSVLLLGGVISCERVAGVSVGELPGVTDLAVQSKTEAEVTLRWTQVDDGTGSPASYLLAYETPTIDWESDQTQAIEVPGTAIGSLLSHTVSGLEPATSYQFQIASARGLDTDTPAISEPSVVLAVTTDPAPSSEPFFADDFDTGSKTDANGFRWTEVSGSDVVHVTADLSYNGTHSLRFRNGPDASGGDSFAEQRFFMGRDLSQVWIEYQLYVPANFEHRNESPNNNKFFMIWRDEYGSGSGTWQAGYEFTTNSELTPNSRIRPMSSREDFLAVESSGLNHPQHNMPFIGGSGPVNVGAWNQIRMEFKAATAGGASDGVMRLWVNGELFASLTDGKFRNYENDPTNVVLRRGYFMGWSNSGFTEQTDFYIDAVRFYSSDPGW